MNTLDIIMPCKGRLNHAYHAIDGLLKQTYKDWRLIFVDFNCPEQSGAKIIDKFHEKDLNRVISLTAAVPADHFNLAESRNFGAKHGSGDYIFFMDADTILESAVFLEEAMNRIQAHGNAYQCGWVNGKATGNLLVKRADFIAVDGYNELCHGWGFEDIDIYFRLDSKGVKRTGFPDGIDNLQHGDEFRVLYYKEKNVQKSNRRNIAISQSKFKGYAQNQTDLLQRHSWMV